MEVSAIKYTGAAGAHGRSPLLRLQSDERLVGLVRRGNQHAYEALVSRYSARLLSFCRHMLGSREDAEDVLQEVFAAAFNAMLADERTINVRPWLYRIARNRSLNHLRRVQAIGVDSMDVHLSEGGQSTAEKVHRREEFRQLISDVGQLPETQRTALLLREIDALAYEQIAEAMETTVPSVKSLLVRARVGLAEAAEARQLTCEEVRLELGEVSEGLRRMSSPVRRHLRTCERCTAFRVQLKDTNRALAAIFPIGPLYALKQALFAHSSAHGGGAAAGSAAAGAGGAASGAAAGGAAASSAGGLLSAGSIAVASKAAAGLAAAAIVTAGAIEVRPGDPTPNRTHHPPGATVATVAPGHGLFGSRGATHPGAQAAGPRAATHRIRQHATHTVRRPTPAPLVAAVPTVAVHRPSVTRPIGTTGPTGPTHPAAPVAVARPVTVVTQPVTTHTTVTVTSDGPNTGPGSSGEAAPPQGSPPPPSGETPQGSSSPPAGSGGSAPGSTRGAPPAGSGSGSTGP